MYACCAYSCPADAKGLLLASIRCPDPVIFFEPKILYRSAVEEVPVGDYEVELGKAKVVRAGTHVTLVGWGNQVNVLAKVGNFSTRYSATLHPTHPYTYSTSLILYMHSTTLHYRRVRRRRS